MAACGVFGFPSLFLFVMLRPPLSLVSDKFGSSIVVLWRRRGTYVRAFYLLRGTCAAMCAQVDRALGLLIPKPRKPWIDRDILVPSPPQLQLVRCRETAWELLSCKGQHQASAPVKSS